MGLERGTGTGGGGIAQRRHRAGWAVRAVPVCAWLLVACGLAAAPNWPAAARADAPSPGGARTDSEKRDEEKPKRTVDAESVVYGDARNWEKPAEVDIDAVYAEISEYKEIVEKKIAPNDARYDLLMAKARKRFRDALQAVAKDGGYDLIAKVGAVKGCESVPVVTKDVIGKL